MNNWKMNLIEGITFLVIGLILLIFNFFAIDPIEIVQKGNQIRPSLNATFVVLIMGGSFFVGAGVAQAAITSTIYKVENDIGEDK